MTEKELQDGALLSSNDDKGDSESVESYHPNNSSDDDKDAPEFLIRHEDRQIKGFRFTAFLILIGAATGTSCLIYALTRRSETASFVDNFEAVSLSLVEKLSYDTSIRFYNSLALADNIVQSLEDMKETALTMEMSAARWDLSTRVARRAGKYVQIAWNPLVESMDDRVVLEKSVQVEQLETVVVRNPPCLMCGSPDLGFIDRETVFSHAPGRSPTDCGTVDDAARSGVYPLFLCNRISPSTAKICTCGPVPPEAAPVVDNEMETELPKSFFQVTEDGEYQSVPNSTDPDDYPLFVNRKMAAPGKFETPPLWVQDSDPFRHKALKNMVENGIPVFSDLHLRKGSYYEKLGGFVGEPTSIVYFPVVLIGKLVGAVSLEIRWVDFVTGILPPSSDLVDIVVETCSGNHTFRAKENLVSLEYVGAGDLHDPRFNHMYNTTTFSDFARTTGRSAPTVEQSAVDNSVSSGRPQSSSIGGNVASRPSSTSAQSDARGRLDNTTSIGYGAGNFTNAVSSTNETGSSGDKGPPRRMQNTEEIDDPGAAALASYGDGFCAYRYMVFATAEMESKYLTNSPVYFTVVAACIFAFTSLLFVGYDYSVRRRQAKTMASAKRTNDIVANLFPHNVRDRMYERAKKDEEDGNKLMDTILANESIGQVEESDPIADFFPNVTIMFLDIAGFTAWSSAREPIQIFKLLEAIFGAFDREAAKMNVFKTIGDCYVAASGLPQPREQHAVVMARFAFSCLQIFSRLTEDLVSTLGPATGDLKARAGLHSGAVTAGVLRGQKARFQLFGDTMNTASRMESSCIPFRIHASRATADSLVAQGKGHWCQVREDPVVLKGKGKMETVWVNPGRKRNKKVPNESTETPESTVDQSVHMSKMEFAGVGESAEEVERHKVRKMERLVDWNADVLYGMLLKVIAGHKGSGSEQTVESMTLSGSVIDERVAELNTPDFAEELGDSRTFEVNPEVKEQLQLFVAVIASMYRNVPFHDFAHASHVLMNAAKLINRIVHPDGIDYNSSPQEISRQRYASTYGISADPLLQFSMVFSALIHDVGHTGLTNSELVEHSHPIAKLYGNKSVAEQNSVDIAWAILSEDRFDKLRNAIFASPSEQRRFRQYLVNAVIATDIADKDLKEDREQRWAAAFSDNLEDVEASSLMRSRATIVFEYIIQASDVAHCLQHWHTYQKFNARLFEERYQAWLSGKLDNEPSVTWYKGELMFLDFYVIPLASRLKQCQVFGVSYDECLNYALENRKEWEIKGSAVVALLLKDCQAKFGTDREEVGAHQDSESLCQIEI